MIEIKEKKKINNVFVWILVIIVIGLVGYIGYDKVYLNKNLKESKQNCDCESVEENTENNIQSNVPAEDTYAFSVTTWNNKLEIDYYLLNDGKLYYKDVSDVEEFYNTYDVIELSGNRKDLIEYKGLDNIKRIKGANTISTGVAFNVLLITEDGKVYKYLAGKENVEMVEFLKEYAVDDIIKYDSVNGCVNDGTTTMVTCGGSYKFTTLDGKTHDITLNTDGTITEN